MNKKKILFVEDEADMMEMVSFRLKKAGYEVIAASDGQEALEKAEKENADLVLLDLMLPKIGGLDVCRRLRLNEKSKNIPIVILTAKAYEKEKESGYACGANAYFTKPFDPESLMEKINKLLQ